MLDRESQACERRQNRRQRVLKSALLQPEGKNQVYDCVARDLSETGARLKIPSPQSLPTQFTFSLRDQSTEKSAKLAWFHGEEVGIQFDQS